MYQTSSYHRQTSRRSENYSEDEHDRFRIQKLYDESTQPSTHTHNLLQSFKMAEIRISRVDTQQQQPQSTLSSATSNSVSKSTTDAASSLGKRKYTKIPKRSDSHDKNYTPPSGVERSTTASTGLTTKRNKSITTRSKSRSTSRSRTSGQFNGTTTKTNTLGAKVYTKKDLVTKRTSDAGESSSAAATGTNGVIVAGKRTLRSGSSVSSTAAEIVAAVAASKLKRVKPELNATEDRDDDLQDNRHLQVINQQTPSPPRRSATKSTSPSPALPSLHMDSDDLLIISVTPPSPDAAAAAAVSQPSVKTYDLRARVAISPAKAVAAAAASRASLTPNRSLNGSSIHITKLAYRIDDQASSSSSSAAAAASSCSTRSGCCFSRCFSSGYLRFTIRQLFQILLASVVLVVALTVINYYSLADTRPVAQRLDAVWSQARRCVLGSANFVVEAARGLGENVRDYFRMIVSGATGGGGGGAAYAKN